MWLRCMTETQRNELSRQRRCCPSITRHSHVIRIEPHKSKPSHQHSYRPTISQYNHPHPHRNSNEWAEPPTALFPSTVTPSLRCPTRLPHFSHITLTTNSSRFYLSQEQHSSRIRAALQSSLVKLAALGKLSDCLVSCCLRVQDSVSETSLTITRFIVWVYTLIFVADSNQSTS